MYLLDLVVYSNRIPFFVCFWIASLPEILYQKQIVYMQIFSSDLHVFFLHFLYFTCKKKILFYIEYKKNMMHSLYVHCTYLQFPFLLLFQKLQSAVLLCLVFHKKQYKEIRNYFTSFVCTIFIKNTLVNFDYINSDLRMK